MSHRTPVNCSTRAEGRTSSNWPDAKHGTSHKSIGHNRTFNPPLLCSPLPLYAHHHTCYLPLSPPPPLTSTLFYSCPPHPRSISLASVALVNVVLRCRYCYPHPFANVESKPVKSTGEFERRRRLVSTVHHDYATRSAVKVPACC